MSSFQLHGLPAAPFRPLFELRDAALARRRMRRVVAEAYPGYPCRVSLIDAQIGEELLLLPFEHLGADSPWRASGPIFVRRDAAEATLPPGVLPASVRERLISVRAYDASHSMQNAEVCEGESIAALLEALLASPRIDYLHLHNARPGCYSCRVTRA